MKKTLALVLALVMVFALEIDRKGENHHEKDL